MNLYVAVANFIRDVNEGQRVPPFNLEERKTLCCVQYSKLLNARMRNRHIALYVYYNLSDFTERLLNKY